MTGYHKSHADELRKTAMHLLFLAESLDKVGATEISASDSKISNQAPFLLSNGLTRLTPVVMAAEIYGLRRMRSRFLPASLFGEPAWDILLDLFSAKISNKKVSVTSACIAADVPTTTGLRWLKILEQERLIIRENHENDLRVTYVSITNYAFSLIENLFISSESNKNNAIVKRSSVMRVK